MKQFEAFRLDTSNECLWQNGRQISLPPKPFAVLRYLVDHPGRLVTHDELLEAIWPDTYVQPQVLRTYMLDLRKLLGDDAGQPRFIQTLPKRGYCFVAAVTDSEAIEVRSADATVHRIPVAILDHGSHRLVGRDRELGLLMGQLQAMLEAKRCVFFITGEAGIGKSALVEAFCQQIGSSPATSAVPVTIACGQCVEGFGAKEEYYPVMEALGQLCASPDGERACQVLARIAPAWLAAIKKKSVTKSVSNAVALERMPGSLCEAIEELAAEKPLVLVFEDLHWADDATLHLIAALARRRARAGLMVLATCRRQEIATQHTLNALKQDLLMRRLCIELALAPLPEPAVRELLVRELKQQALPPGLTAFVHQHSEGNPLFAIAILEHLIAQRFLVCDGSWKQRAPFQEMEAGVPEGLAQMIELEISRLPPAEQCMLEAGSLISVAFPAWAVAAALEQDAAEIEEACDGLSRRLYFLERAGQDELPDGTRSAFYVFAHGLYREVLYQRQAPARRAKRHVRIADRLGELFHGREASVAREMAFHYEAAGHWSRAVDSLLAAARHAHRRQAAAEAAELLEHALQVAQQMHEDGGAIAFEEIRSALTMVRETAVRETAVRETLEGMSVTGAKA